MRRAVRCYADLSSTGSVKNGRKQLTQNMMSHLRKRLSKLRGLPPTGLLEVLQFKAGLALQSQLQDFRLCVLGKIWRKPDLRSVLGLKKEIQFFGLDGWASRKADLARILEG